MHELWLFDFADHLERLLQTGDLFEALDRYVDFEVLRPVPTGAPGYGVRPKGRRPPREGFDMIVMASAKGDFPNYEIGPNLARVVRNAHCTVMVIRD